MILACQRGLLGVLLAYQSLLFLAELLNVLFYVKNKICLRVIRKKLLLRNKMPRLG